MGPLKVTAKIGAVAYRLEMPERFRHVHPVFHISLLRAYKEESESLPPPLPETVDDDGFWEVEKIYDHRDVKSSS